MTSISNQEDLENWDGSSEAVLNSNFTLSGFSTKNLSNGAILNGNRHTITLNNRTTGLFNIMASATVIIKNLIVNANPKGVLTFNHGILMAYQGTNPPDNWNLTIENCGIIGNYDVDGEETGTFYGNGDYVTGITLTIKNCFSTGDISGKNSGGICGSRMRNGVALISHCYTTGVISGAGAGGIVGAFFGQNSSSVPIIRNCYSTGNVTGKDSGAITGRRCGDSGKYSIENCYSMGEIIGSQAGGMTGPYLGGGADTTVKNCYSMYATDTNKSTGGSFYGAFGSSEPSTEINNLAGNSSSWNETIDSGNGLVSDDGEGDTDVWITSGLFASGFGLKVFAVSPWESAEYTSNTSNAVFRSFSSLAVARGIDSGNIATLESVSLSSGATLSDSSALTAISNSITGTTSQKAERRRASIGLIFENNINMTNFKIAINNLSLTSTFTGLISSNIDTIIAVKAGEYVDTSVHENNEGVYVPLENGDFVTLYDGTVTKTLERANDQYTISSEDTLTYDINSSSAPNFNFDNPPTGYLEEDDYVKIGTRILYIGSGEEGEEEDSGNICFPEGTSVETDQGPTRIENITTSHSINGKKVIELVKKINTSRKLVLFKKDSIKENVPNKNTYTTTGHKVFVKGKLVKAKKLVNREETIVLILREKNEPIYNVLLSEHHHMTVNGMITETLHPNYEYFHQEQKKKKQNEKYALE
jgi:hypothetical protein